jgi:hypothetical protein
MNLFFIKPVEAVCPVCTIAVGAGVGISRLIGIDDSITGVWIGGLIISSGLWMADFIRKKQWKIPIPEILSILLMLLFVIPPLYWSNMIGVTNNTLLGIDKIIFGSVIGSLIFFLGVGIDKLLRLINNDKVYIYYQKVILPVLLLSIVSLILYLITS